MAEGELTPDEAASLACVIEAKRKMLETEELDQGCYGEMLGCRTHKVTDCHSR